MSRLLTEDKRRVFADVGMNWTWFTELVDHQDGTCTILRHFGLHDFDSDRGACDPIREEAVYTSNRIVEDSERVAVAFKYSDTKSSVNLRVRNPRNIFDYDTKE